MKATQVQARLEKPKVDVHAIHSCRFCNSTLRPTYGVRIGDHYYCDYRHYTDYVHAMRGGA